MNERCCAPKTKAWVEGSTRIFTRCKRLSTISTNELCWTGATACRRASRAPVRLCRCREAQGIPGASWVYPRAKDRGAGYLNIKGYKEFAAQNRPDGWNTWVTFVLSPAEQTATVPPRRMIAK